MSEVKTSRKVDLLSKKERDGLKAVRILFFYLPVIFSLFMVTAVLLSHHHLAIRIVVVLAAVPLILLAIGFAALDIGFYQSMRGEYSVAECCYRIAIPLMSIFRIGPLMNFHVLPTTILAELLMLTGKYPEAEQFYEKNAKLCDKGRGGKDIIHGEYFITMLKDIGVCRYESGDYANALTPLAKALILILHECYPDDTTVGMPNENDKVTEEKVVYFGQLVLRQLKFDHPLFLVRARTILYLGATLRATGNVKAGCELITSTMKLLQQYSPPKDPDMFAPYFEYALALKDSGNMENARINFAEAQEIAINSYNSRHPKLLLIQTYAQLFQ